MDTETIVPDFVDSVTESTPVFHTTVLRSEAVEALHLSVDSAVLDATVGGAGHFSDILSMLSTGGTLIGIDADADAIERARERVRLDTRADRPMVHLVEDNFRNLDRVLDRIEVETLDAALFDLGWSGFQLAGGRGFSFQVDEPLLMTYGRPEAGKTAADLVNSLPEAELADLIYQYGEERYSRPIARAIVAARKEGHIVSTVALAEVIASAVPAAYRNGRINPATKTFQALRIAVNDEFGALSEGLASAFRRLSPGGRLAVISFHSSEDRIVKQFMRDRVAAGEGHLATKKSIVPSAGELSANRRARSAKLRTLVKGPFIED